MSTRANIVIIDEYSQIFFYRHSDGYPEGTLPTLEKFLSLVKEGKIRGNASQSSGWLIIIGAEEYGIPRSIGYEWKVGSYEPTDGLHADAEYLYIVNVNTHVIEFLNKYGPNKKDLNQLIKKSRGQT